MASHMALRYNGITYTCTSKLRDPHTRTRRPTHPNSETPTHTLGNPHTRIRTLGPAHPHTRTQRPAHPHAGTQRPAQPDPQTCTPRPADPHTQTQRHAHPDPYNRTPTHPHNRNRKPVGLPFPSALTLEVLSSLKAFKLLVSCPNVLRRKQYASLRVEMERLLSRMLFSTALCPAKRAVSIVLREASRS
jgi:hypothetical protein